MQIPPMRMKIEDDRENGDMEEDREEGDMEIFGI